MATRSALSAIVKSKIDELTPFDGGLSLITAPGNTGNNPVEIYIDQFLDDSAKETLLEAPYHVLTSTAFVTIVYTLALYKALITIPADYLRVASIKFSAWERPVYRATYPGDPEYSRQFNTWLRGGKAKPVATWISDGGAGKLVCYGVVSATGNELYYIAKSVAESTPEKIHDALTWHCASLVLQVFEKTGQSETAYARYIKALSIL